jgi:membrane fusion protein (multidrug efflux system)
LQIGLLGILASCAFWVYSVGRESTNNARIEGPVHAISARLEGEVSEVFVELNQVVRAGEPLFQLDARDAEVALQRAQAALASATAAYHAASSTVPVTSVAATSDARQATAAATNARLAVEAAQSAARNAQAQARAAAAALEQAESRAQAAQRDLERWEPLATKQQISAQRLDDLRSAARAMLAAAVERRAQLDAAQEALAIATSQIEQSRGELLRAQARQDAAATAPQKVEAVEAEAALAAARVTEAEAGLARAELDLADTTVRAPAAGVIGRKNLEIGQRVQRGQPVIALVGTEVWVEANYKETQLRKMRPGLPATIRVDAYSGTLHGSVESIGPATGSRFSLLPADNSSGNFVKVVQRVPIKIVLDPDSLAQYSDNERARPLRPGMSVHTTVHLRRGND